MANRRVVGGVVVAVFLAIVARNIFRSCGSNDKTLPTGVSSAATPTKMTEEEIQKLLKKIEQLEAKLAERSAPSSESSSEPSAKLPATGIASLGEKLSAAVRAILEFWEKRSRELKMETAKKISEAEEAEERKLQLQDRIVDVEKEIDYHEHWIAVHQAMLSNPFESAGQKAYHRQEIRERKEKIADLKAKVIEMKASL